MTDQGLRDTRTYYLDLPPDQLVASGNLEWARERAGHAILDLGCATGAYCVALGELGFSCRGVDVNGAYVELARQAGVDAEVVRPGEPLPFADGTFDTVILYEVLEHVADYRQVLEEARRVTRRNVLITVPNNGEQALLRSVSLTFDHMLDVDHVNFFTKDTLESALAETFSWHCVEEREPRDLSLLFELLPLPLRAIVLGLARLRLYRPRLSYRLYAEARP